MAIRQKLKGDQNNPNINKTYDVLINFNKGIDKRAADDLANDSSFRELSNFWNEKEGILTKRPGLYDTHFTSLFYEMLTSGMICGENFDLSSLRKPNALNIFYNTVLQGSPHYYSNEGQYYSRRLMPKAIIGMQILKDDNFHTLLENYKPDEYNHFGAYGIPSIFEFNALFVCACDNQYLKAAVHEGESDEWVTSEYSPKGLIITKIHIKRDKISDTAMAKFDIDQVTTGDNFYCPNQTTEPEKDYHYRWGFNLSIDEPLDIVSYNDYSYIPTGYDYIIRVKNDFPETDAEMNFDEVPVPTDYSNYEPVDESIMIVPIGGLTKENLYKPTPIEVSNIGFNILSSDPLNFYDTGTGSTDAIKGVFFSYTKGEVNEPIATIPPNSPFNIHILSTGSSSISTPQYRPNNGDTSTTSNPYKNLNGTLNNGIFACTGLDYDGEIEIKITKGTSTYIGYISTGSDYTQEIGYVSNIKDLIYSSKRIKVINNQLVLYGGHGYIFFSDYDNFQYFPNYFFVYAATDAEEKEVTNISYFRQYYAIFTNKRIKRMTGAFGSDNFGLFPLNDFVGCPNGRTVKQVNNSLFFLNIDGLYRLKQGYVGEGTENVERIDDVLGSEINSDNVLQAFVLNDYYIMVRKDKSSLMIYDFTKDNFFEFDLNPEQCPVALNPNINITGMVRNHYLDEPNLTIYDTTYPRTFDSVIEEYRPFKICFQSEMFDEYGSCIYVPEYKYDYVHSTGTYLDPDYYMEHGQFRRYTRHMLTANRNIMTLRELRMSDLEFLDKDVRHKDATGFISAIETPKLNMGSPTNTKKFKELYIKMTNENLEPIPLYLTIYIDDIAYITPEDYYVEYDSDTQTYYYVFRDSSNTTLAAGAKILEAQEVLGTLTLGEDVLGNQTIMQLKIKINKKGRSIKIALRDGFDDTSDIGTIVGTDETLCYYNRLRNTQNFSIIAMGIVYKLKKVKEG